MLVMKFSATQWTQHLLVLKMDLAKCEGYKVPYPGIYIFVPVLFCLD